MALMALGPDIDPEEAARAARISYDYPLRLREEYQVSDPPIVHNSKVNMGLRPRGLCWQWAEDMEARLKAENFQTLQIHRAIANSDVAFRIDHSTALISRRGETMYEGIVVDPWRYGGALYWSTPQADKSYKWRPRREVLEEKRQRLQSRARRAR
ncbi:hypothetical protein GCM10010973_30520 [Cribrihabitans marinus]|nr:hypothetical protein GCM10010973_30520 [Cribrihabitans marinus]